jgi:hypothetical protein
MAAAAGSVLTMMDISGLLPRIESIERALSNYIKTESAIQESKTIQRVLDKIHTYYPTLLAKQTDLKYVYTPTGGLLTDLDGCIVVSAKPPKPVQRNGFRNNSLGFNPATDFARTIILEAKHSLTKAKVDTKILQMYKLKELFHSLPSFDFDHAVPAFQAMIEDHGFHNYPGDFYLLFAADDMDYDVRRFLLAVSGGITKEAYNDFAMSFLKKDPFYKTIKRNSTIPKKLKATLHATKTIEEALSVLENPVFRDYALTFLRILVPYEAIVHYYNQFVNRIGFLQFDTLFLPELFPYPMPDPRRIGGFRF